MGQLSAAGRAARRVGAGPGGAISARISRRPDCRRHAADFSALRRRHGRRGALRVAQVRSRLDLARDPQPVASTGIRPACDRRSGSAELARDLLSHRRCRRRRTERPVLASAANPGDRARAVDYRRRLCPGGFLAVVAAIQTRSDRAADERLAGSRRHGGRCAARAAVPSFVAADQYGLAAELARYLPAAVPVIAIGPRWSSFNLPPAAVDGMTGILVEPDRHATPIWPAARGDRDRGARTPRRRNRNIPALSGHPRPLDERRALAASAQRIISRHSGEPEPPVTAAMGSGPREPAATSDRKRILRRFGQRRWRRSTYPSADLWRRPPGLIYLPPKLTERWVGAGAALGNNSRVA